MDTVSKDAAQPPGAGAAPEDGEDRRPLELSDRARRLVAEIEDVPTLPAVVSEVARLTADPEIAAKKIAEAISSDQALTGRLLRIVNSAYYGFSRQISTVQDAIVIMGTTALRAAVLGASVFQAFERGLPESAYELFRAHSARVAEAARQLGRSYGVRETGEVHVAGLLHDIGKLLIALYFPEEHKAIAKHCEKAGLPSMVGERKYLGTTHGELGGWLADRWQLPLPLREGILHHHRPAAAGDQKLVACLVYLGDTVAHQASILEGNEDVVPPASKSAWDYLQSIRPDIDEEEIPSFAEELLKAQERVSALSAGLARA